MIYEFARDRVHLRDQQEMVAGRITPTHMLAVVANDRDRPTLFTEPLSPEFCMRRPDPRPTWGARLRSLFP